jgi:hypothetical protein
MNWKDWDSVKENIQRGYLKAAQWFLFGNVLLFFVACAVAGGPVGPIGYIEFLYHCCHWRVKGGG